MDPHSQSLQPAPRSATRRRDGGPTRLDWLAESDDGSVFACYRGARDYDGPRNSSCIPEAPNEVDTMCKSVLCSALLAGAVLTAVPHAAVAQATTNFPVIGTIHRYDPQLGRVDPERREDRSPELPLQMGRGTGVG